MRKWGIKSGLKVFFLRSVLGWSVAILFGAAGLFAARLLNISKLPTPYGPWGDSDLPAASCSPACCNQQAARSIEQNGSLLLKKLFRDAPMGSIPDIPDPLWKWIDLSAGLLMVGIFEEVVFRVLPGPADSLKYV